MDVRYNAGRGGVGGGGGGCVARYFGGGLYDLSMVERMMLKFRPIAPKPVSGSGDCKMGNGGQSGGGRRKYVRVNKENKKRKISTSILRELAVSGGGSDAVVTLSLMPETPDRKENSPPAISSSSENLNIASSPIWLSVESKNQTSGKRQQTVVSWVEVEGVTETCVDKWWMEMESDRCPGFISDGEDRVVWTNKAYREMAGGEEVAVVLVRKKMMGYPAAFTCNLRVTCRSGGNCSTLTVPCDAWRMEGGGGGGYAWRLDLKAALSLGR